MNYEECLAYLEKEGQQHLLMFYDELSEAEKSKLLAEIEAIDFTAIRPTDEPVSSKDVRPIDALTVDEIALNEERFTAAGLEAIRAGKVAALLLAGGQGTRLGLEGPKGAYNVGVTRNLYIFECLINNLQDVVRQAGCYIPLVIMTSDKNDAATRAFFEEHDFFGYNKNYVDFFVQEMAPATDFNGKIFLEDKGRISLSPNGNGGWFVSLTRSGLSEKLKKMGVEWINVFSVDNVLQRMVSPAFVGATILSGKPIGSKVVGKNAPDERVGVMCLRDGRPSIVEYYELSDEMANQLNADGTRAYNWGVILNYLFRVDALEKANSLLPLHRAEKKIPYIDADGNYVRPDVPNGYKYEQLVLDMIQTMDGCLVYEVVREKEFAPIKNAEGKDSPESARALMRALGMEL